MKLLIRVFFIVFIAFTVYSCGSDKSSNSSHTNESNVHKEIEIPEELTSHEARQYFKTYAAAVDEFASILDKVMMEIEEMDLEPGEEPGTFQKLKILKIFAENAPDLSKHANEINDLQNRHFMIEQELTEQEKKAFVAVYERFQKRMQELEEKYKTLQQFNKEQD